MWWIVPVALVALSALCFLLAFHVWDDGPWAMVGLLLGFFALISIIGFPTRYYQNRNDVWRMEAYYDNIIRPNVVAETPTTVTISNLEAGVWQAGDTNLPDYNKDLRIQKYWQATLWGKLSMYPIPATYKFVQVKGQ